MTKKGKKTTSRSPSKSKCPEHPPSPTNETQNLNLISNDVNSGGEESREPPQSKTPEEVLAELTTIDNENIGGTRPPPLPTVGEGQSGGAGVGSMAMALGTSAVAMTIAASGHGAVVLTGVRPVVGAAKKRKNSAVKDPPSGIPTCPICFKTFASWKGAFGHMRKHPDRDYRGFFKPPTFSPKPAAGVAGEGSSAVLRGGEGGSASSPIRRLLFDLNLPLEELVDGEGNKVGFDLNEFPAIDDDEEEEDKA